MNEEELSKDRDHINYDTWIRFDCDVRTLKFKF